MTNLNITFVVAVIGAVTGVLGVTLGILNTWRSFDRDRIKLKVTPQLIIFVGGTRFGVEVLNLSYIPVTVTQVSFSMRNNHFLAFTPQPPGNDLPARMEPRTKVSIWLPAGMERDPSFAEVTTAFALTACGKKFTGTSGALKQIIQEARLHQQ